MSSSTRALRLPWLYYFSFESCSDELLEHWYDPVKVNLEKESSSLSFSLFSVLNPERFSSTVKVSDYLKLFNYFWPIFKFWPISN